MASFLYLFVFKGKYLGFYLFEAMFTMTVCFSEAVICKYFHFDSTELDKSAFVLLQCNLFTYYTMIYMVILYRMLLHIYRGKNHVISLHNYG